VSTASDLRRAAAEKLFALFSGEDFAVAAATARARATSRDWHTDPGLVAGDFRALVLDSNLVASSAEDAGAKAPAALLDRTWAVLAKKDGYDPNAPAPKPSGAQANIGIEIAALIAVVVGTVAGAAIAAYLIYRASQIATAWLAIDAASQEMVRCHADAMTMLEAHRKREALTGAPIPFDAGELAILQRLQDSQDAALSVQGATVRAAASPPVGASEGLLIGLGLAAVAAYFLFGRSK